MPFVRPDVQAVLDMLAASPAPKMHEVDADTARMMMRTMGQITELPRGDLARVEELSIPSPHGHAIPARLYANTPKGGAAAPVLVFYHGGGWVIGDLETHDPLCAEICRTLGMTVVSIDYRLAPEHRFPAATEDCLAATRWVASSPAEIGHRVSGLVLAGDSAGGNLTAACSQELHGKLAVPILAQWLIYPGVDMNAAEGSMQEFSDGYLLTEEGMIWFMNHYFGDQPEAARNHPYASPMHGPDFANQPPTLLFTCGLDPLRDQGRAYGGKLIAHGVPLVFREAPGQIHGCLNLRQALPSAQADLLGCLAALKAIVAEAQAGVVAAETRVAAE